MTQTDVAAANASSQTDDHYFKSLRRKEAEKKKLLALPKAKAKPQVAETKPFQKKRSGFGAHEAKKQKMREALIRPSYNVHNLYYTQGCAQCIARSALFESLTFVVILLNAIWIAIDTDNNDAVVLLDADRAFQITENAFCTFFTAELLIRFLSFKEKRRCVHDWSFVFDFVLVLGMVIETWIVTGILLFIGRSDGSYAAGLGNFSILRVARLVKMLRMARMARLLRMVPELVVIVKSIGVAFRSVGFFFLLMVIVLYGYAVFFRQVTKNSAIGEQYFGSVIKSMNSLLLDGVLPLYAPLVRDVAAANPWFWPLMMSFILLASVTVMNMLIGVLVEVVRMVAEREREAMTVIHVTNELREVMHQFVQDQMEQLDSNAGPINSRQSNVRMSTVQSFANRTTKALEVVNSATRRRKQASELSRWNAEIPDMSKDTFELFLSSPAVVSLLRDCGVDAIGILDSVDMIYDEKVADGDLGLSFVDFVDIVLNMRGTNPATVKDVKEQMRLLKSAFTENGRANSKLFMDGLQKFRMDIFVQLNELRKSIDSDAGSDDDGFSVGASGDSLHWMSRSPGSISWNPASMAGQDSYGAMQSMMSMGSMATVGEDHEEEEETTVLGHVQTADFGEDDEIRQPDDYDGDSQGGDLEYRLHSQ